MVLNPLAKDEIAKKFGVHVSTVVRLHSLFIFVYIIHKSRSLLISRFLLLIFFFLLSSVVCFYFLFFLQVFVPPGKDSITKALKKRTNTEKYSVGDQSWRNVRVLYLQAGTHTSPIWKDMPKINGEIPFKTVNIPHSMIVSGAGRGVTFLTGNGFEIHQNCAPGKVTFMDMTVHKTQSHGLCIDVPIPFDCVRMHFDQCGNHGVYINYDTVYMKPIVTSTQTIRINGGRFTNCQITGSKWAGLSFNPHNKIIQIEGAETLFEDNVLGDVTSPSDNRFKNEKEFLAANPNATRTQSCIQILLPLTNFVALPGDSDLKVTGSLCEETVTVSLVDSF